ncbi:Autoinducer 2 sensor kinase/phosphatase LuxQ [compost metagenome]
MEFDVHAYETLLAENDRLRRELSAARRAQAPADPGAATGVGSPTFIAAFSALDAFAALLSPQSHILAITDTYLRAAHLRREDVVGRSAFEVFPDSPDNPSANGVSNMQASLDRVLTLKQRDELPFQRYDIEQPDGSFEERYWRAWNLPILGPDGEVRFILHQAEELSAAARLAPDGPGHARPAATAASAHVEEEVRFALAAKATNDAIWDWNIQTGELLWHEGICRSFGYRWDEIEMTERWREERLHPDDRDSVLAAMQAACHDAGENVWRGDYRFRRADGTYAWVSDRGYCVRDAAGRPVRMVGAMHDTTVYKQAEALLQSANRQLEHDQAANAEAIAQQSDALRKGIEHRARLVVERQAARSEAQERTRERDRLWETSVDLLAVIDELGHFERLSPSWEPTLGWTPHELGHRPFIEFVHPDDVSSTLAQYERTRQGAPAVHFENRYRCKDGTYRWIAWSASHENGKLYCVARDVTHAKAQEAELRRQTEALARANAYKDQFLDILSHELRTPLNVITGFGSILADELEGPLNAAQRTSVARILGGADRMGALVDALLPADSVQTGRPPLSATPVAFCEALDEALAQARPLAEAKGLTIAAASCEPGFVVLADSRHLVHILSVLLTNAVTFTPEGGVQVRVFIAGDTLRCEVADTGIGIAPEAQAAIFESFMQADLTAPRQSGGTGLGLSIAKKLVETYGGQIGVESELGAGATFWLRLPLAPAAA